MSAAPLRPLGIGDIVDRVVTLYRANFKLFVLAAALPSLLTFVAEGALAIAFPNQPTFADSIALFQALGDPRRLAELSNQLSAAGPPPTVAFAVGVVAFVVTLVQGVAVMDVVGARHLGRDAAVGAALGLGVRNILRLFFAWVVGAIAFAIVFGVVALILTLEVAGIIAVAAGRGGPVAIAVAVLLVTEVAVVAFGGMGLAVATLLVEAPVAAFERTGPIRAFRRAWALMGGSRRRLVGLLFLLYVLYVVLTLGVSATLVAAVAADKAIVGFVTIVVGLAADVFWAPIFWGTVVVTYYDLRVRREAFDLQLASETLPRAT